MLNSGLIIIGSNYESLLMSHNYGISLACIVSAAFFSRFNLSGEQGDPRCHQRHGWTQSHIDFLILKIIIKKRWKKVKKEPYNFGLYKKKCRKKRNKIREYSCVLSCRMNNYGACDELETTFLKNIKKWQRRYRPF